MGALEGHHSRLALCSDSGTLFPCMPKKNEKSLDMVTAIACVQCLMRPALFFPLSWGIVKVRLNTMVDDLLARLFVLSTIPSCG